MTDDVGSVQHSGAMSLGGAVTGYLAALTSFIALCWAAWHNGSAELLLIAAAAYLVLGVCLSRLVLRRLVEWHPVYDTIANVSSAKLTLFAYWPIAYPLLFIKMAIAKAL